MGKLSVSSSKRFDRHRLSLVLDRVPKLLVGNPGIAASDRAAYILRLEDEAEEGRHAQQSEL